MAIYYIRENGTVTLESENDIVVVSPTLYWYAHADFPTKSLAKARKLADAFLDSRPESYGTIHVEKREGGFDCYAYDKEALKTRIEAVGANDAPAYFLQQLSAKMPIRIDDGLIADIINDICIELPDGERTLPTLDTLDFESVAKPFRHPKSGPLPKSLIIALISLLAVTMVVDLAHRFQEYSAIQKALEKSGGDRSVYEIKSLVKRYEKTAMEQKKLRESIRKALQQGTIRKLDCTPAKGCRRE